MKPRTKAQYESALRELRAFINACLDAKSADELLDFVQNNAEDVLAKADGEK